MISIDSGALVMLGILAMVCFVFWLLLRHAPQVKTREPNDVSDYSDPEDHVIELTLLNDSLPEEWECGCGAEGSYLASAREHVRFVLEVAEMNHRMSGWATEPMRVQDGNFED